MGTHASSNAKSNEYVTQLYHRHHLHPSLPRASHDWFQLCLTCRSSTGGHGQLTELCSDTIIMKLYQVDGYGYSVLTLCHVRSTR